MFARLLALFLLVPLVDLALLVRLGGVIGFWPTVGIVVATGFAGSYLARREGLATWRRLQQTLGAGGLPGAELVDGVIILVSGALLLAPGVITDVAGLLGLLPFTRAPLRREILRRLKRRAAAGTALHFGFGGFGGPTAPPSGVPDEHAAWHGEGRAKPRHQEGHSDTAPPVDPPGDTR